MVLHLYDRMNFVPFCLYTMFLFDSALGSLPAPVNVAVHSVNFHHVLRWDPGPGTPDGTQYSVFARVNGNKQTESWTSTATSMNLILNEFKKYFFSVQASYNRTLSPKSQSVAFTAFEDTKIGPPKLSLAGCGNCIDVNISMPEAHKTSNISDIRNFYDFKFRVLWRKTGAAVNVHTTKEKNFTLTNLEVGEEYCIQVQTDLTINRNTEPSVWTCTFTSIVEPSRVPFALGTAAGLLIVCIGVPMIAMFCLYYTGFLCKLKATLPRPLIMDYKFLTLERTEPEQITHVSDKQKKHNNHIIVHPATRVTSSGDKEDEEEEDEGKQLYIDRDVGNESSESSCQESDMSWNTKLAAPLHSGSLAVRLSDEAEQPNAEFDIGVTHWVPDQDEVRAEETAVSLMPKEWDKGHISSETEENITEKASPRSVNLFSVTLAAMAVGEEEAQEQETRCSIEDFFTVSDLEPLQPHHSKLTLCHTDLQTDEQAIVALMQSAQEGVNETGYESRHEDTFSVCGGETQEELEEEEFSGYMTRA